MNSLSVPVVTLDGPSGSGKGAIGRNVCQRLSWRYLDSGAVYRVLALSVQESGVDHDDVVKIVQIVETLKIKFDDRSWKEQHIYLNDRDVSHLIRTESIAKIASYISVFPSVRTVLNKYFQCFKLYPGLVADGRDMGSVVFPDALVKVFLDASPQIRAERRYKQLKDKGINVSLTDIYTDILLRDERDVTRAVAPLRSGLDTVVIDTSVMTIEAVVNRVCGLVETSLIKLNP